MKNVSHSLTTVFLEQNLVLDCGVGMCYWIMASFIYHLWTFRYDITKTDLLSQSTLFAKFEVYIVLVSSVSLNKWLYYWNLCSITSKT